MTDVFPKTEVVYLSCGLRYVDEILLANSFWPFEESDVNKYEAGSSIVPPQLPS